MKRFCSQFIFCSPERVLKQAVVEQNEFGVISDLFLLSNRHSEPAHTVFINGIISAEIISLKQQLPPEKFIFVQSNYQYIDLSSGILPDNILPDDRLMLDFGTNSTTEINDIIRFAFPLLFRLSIFDILSACVYRPALLMQQEAELTTGVKTKLFQWKGIDLLNRKITEKTKIVELS